MIEHLDDGPLEALLADESVTEVNPETGEELLLIRFANSDDNVPLSRSYTLRHDQLALARALVRGPNNVAVVAGDGSLSVSWLAVAGASGYTVQWKSGLQEYDDSREQAVPTNRTTISGLDNGTEYTVRVRANGPWSAGAPGTPVPPSPPGGGPRTSAPGAPRNLTAVVGDGEIVLSWDAPASDGGAAITDYEYRINGRNPWTSIGSTLTTHTVTSLVNGTVYVFEVRAVNRIGKSRASSQAEATPEAPEGYCQVKQFGGILAARRGR